MLWLVEQLLLPTKEFAAFNSTSAEFSGLQEFVTLSFYYPCDLLQRTSYPWTFSMLVTTGIMPVICKRFYVLKYRIISWNSLGDLDKVTSLVTGKVSCPDLSCIQAIPRPFQYSYSYSESKTLYVSKQHISDLVVRLSLRLEVCFRAHFCAKNVL